MEFAMRKALLSIPIILLLVGQRGYGQSLASWVTAADSAYAKRDFYSAYKYYGAALEFRAGEKDMRLWYQYAESAREFNIYHRAIEGYQRVLDNEQSATYPLARYWLGHMKQRLTRYQEAGADFEQFLQETSAEDDALRDYRRWAEKGVQDCAFALSRLSETMQLTVEALDPISTEFSEFGGVRLGDTLYYTSFQYRNPKDKNRPPRLISKVLQSYKGETVGQPLTDDFNVPGKLTAHSAFNKDASQIYYTICDYVENKGLRFAEVRCDLYFRQRDSTGAWGPAKLLSANDGLYTNTQPNVGYDKAAGKEILFFVSDRPGGKGGLDIWSGEIETSGDVLTVRPVEAINTDYNDVTPFFLALTQTLYFSSEGYPSMGGYDVYQATRKNGGWTVPTHVPHPINTSYDDLYFTLSPDGGEAHFTSNRIGSKRIDDEACCSDVFRSEFANRLIVNIFDDLTKAPLPQATLGLYLKTPDGEQLLDSLVLTNNRYTTPLLPGMEYVVRARKAGFSSAFTEVDLTELLLQRERIIERDLYLAPPVKLLVTTFKRINGNPLNNAQVYQLEINGLSNNLIASKNNPTGNRFEFELERGLKYAIQGTRNGFFPEGDSIDLNEPVYRTATGTIERELRFSQHLEVQVFDAENRRPLNGATVRLDTLGGLRPVQLAAKTNATGHQIDFGPFDMDARYRVVASRPGYNGASVDPAFSEQDIIASQGKFVVPVYLEPAPINTVIRLYFDNDQPNPGTRLRRTNVLYLSTYQAYYAKKQQFIEQARFDDPSLAQADREIVAERYDNFFDREVREGVQNLDDFCKRVLLELQQGKTVEFTIEGVSSPRGNAPYNLILSERRIDCAVNQLMAYERGAMRAYYKLDNSGKLKINRKANGASNAPKEAIENLSKGKGIFDVFSSIERRVEIKDVKLY